MTKPDKDERMAEFDWEVLVSLVERARDDLHTTPNAFVQMRVVDANRLIYAIARLLDAMAEMYVPTPKAPRALPPEIVTKPKHGFVLRDIDIEGLHARVIKEKADDSR